MKLKNINSTSMRLVSSNKNMFRRKTHIFKMFQDNMRSILILAVFAVEDVFCDHSGQHQGANAVFMCRKKASSFEKVESLSI